MPKNIELSKNDLITRAVSMAPQTFDETANSVRAIATTEKPTRVFDYDRYDFVDEILRMDGCILPESGQVPLLNSHSRHGVEDVLGSAADFEVVEVGGAKALQAEVTYSETPEGASAAQKTKEGHLTDYSVGYRVKPNGSYWIPEGQKQIIGGVEYDGPVKVVTSWELRELSATPIGADEYAKARSQKFKIEETKKMPKSDEKKQTRKDETQVENETRSAAKETQKVSDAEISRAKEEGARAERKRVQAIQQRCQVACIDLESADGFIERGLSLEQVSEEIFRKMEKGNKALGSNRTEIVADAGDKFRDAAIDGICMRSQIPIEKPALGHEDFRGRSLLRIAEESVIIAGGSVRGLNKLELAATALGMRGVIGSSTSDFPLIMSNVANKKLMQSWQEAPVTWDSFCNVVDATDFKPMQSIDVSALPQLSLLNENGEYKEVKLSETGESYAIRTFGNMFYLSRTMIINDDMRVFLKIPNMFGAAGKRTINNHVFNLLNSNPTLSSGKTLFHDTHKNICSTGGKPSVETLSEGRKLMRKFKDPGGKANLNLVSRFLVAGSNHETDIDIVLLSAALPEDGKSSGVINPFKGKLTPIIDSTQDNYDEDAWFLFPDKTAADTIEVAFLDGVQAPYLEDKVDFDTDGIKFKCRLDFGVGAMSSKIVKNPGK
ncbi:MAG: hypothetical protein GY729_07035 [Desulfobacteraceae bacterium]|nr:hypothetical protein [Desulfobacteraceae bacterium]